MSEKISFQDLIDKLCERSGVGRAVSETFLREFFDMIVRSLRRDGQCKIKGLGTFKLKSVDERKSVSVQNGSEIIIPAHVKLSFSPEKALREDVNKPYAHLHTYILADDAPVEMTDDVDDESDSEEDMQDMEVEVKSNRPKIDISSFILDSSSPTEDEPVFAERVHFDSDISSEVKPPRSIVIDPIQNVSVSATSQSGLNDVAEPQSLRSIVVDPITPQDSPMPNGFESNYSATPKNSSLAANAPVEERAEVSAEPASPKPEVSSSASEAVTSIPKVEEQVNAAATPVAPKPETNNYAPETTSVSPTTEEHTKDSDELMVPKPETNAQTAETTIEEVPTKASAEPIAPEPVVNVEATKPLAQTVESTIPDEENRKEVATEEAPQPMENKEAEAEEKSVGEEKANRMKASAPVDKNNGQGVAVKYLLGIIILLLFALLGTLGYLYKNEISELLGDKKENPAEKVIQVEDAVNAPNDVKYPNADETQDQTQNSFDGDDVTSQSEVPAEEQSSESVIEQSFVESSAEPVSEVPAYESKPEKKSKYKFDSELVNYMETHNSDMDLTVNDIIDEVVLEQKQRLVDVALKYYGHKYYWVYLYYFNRDVIKNPNVVKPGTRLKVPKLSKSLVNSADKHTLDVAYAVKKDLVEK